MTIVHHEKGARNPRRERFVALMAELFDILYEPVEETAPAVTTSTATPQPLVDKRELARMLSVSPATVDRLVRAGLPFVPVGDVRRFDVTACRAWLEEQGERRAEAGAPASRPRVTSASTTETGSGEHGGVRLLSRRGAGR
jgi:hypothetical protein